MILKRLKSSRPSRKWGPNLRSPVAPLSGLNEKLSLALGLCPVDSGGLNLAWGTVVASTLGVVASFYAVNVVEPVRIVYCESAAGNCTFFWSLLIDFLIFTVAVVLCPAVNFFLRSERETALKFIHRVDAGLNFTPSLHKIDKVIAFFYVYLSLLIFSEFALNTSGDLEGITAYIVENGLIFLSDVYFLVLEIEFFGIAWSFQKRFKAINEAVSLLIFPKWNKIPTVFSNAAQETATSRFDRLVDLHWYLSQGVSSINKVYGFKLGMLLFYLFYRLLIIPHVMTILITTTEDGLSMKVWWFMYHACQLALLVLPAADSAKNGETLIKTICQGLGTSTHVVQDQVSIARTGNLPLFLICVNSPSLFT
nr:PREDICTED: uncharacterized protein LOC109033506 [Bemisia tabaci]